MVRRLNLPALELHQTVGSTMDLAHRAAQAGCPDGLLILADEQASGRGRRGQPWLSPPGSGIWMTLVLRPRDAGAVIAGSLALRAGLELAESLADLEIEAKVKWPNDVLVDNRKVAGLLCEARSSPERVRWVAVGLGVNVHGPVPAALPFAAALDEFAPGITRIAVLDRLIHRLRRLSLAATMDVSELQRFAACDWLRDRELVAPVAGRAAGIAPDGALLVQTDAGVKKVYGGTVVSA